VAAVGLVLGAGWAPAAAETSGSSNMSSVAPCLFQNCQLQLAKCVLNPNCAANLTCIIACSNSPDEKTEKTCQIKCGDNFENDVVGEFNACALSSKRCVPQRPDTGPMPGEVTWDPVKGRYPLPPDDAVVTKFDVGQMTGRWYITAGLNPLFDTFDCQAHFFEGKGPEADRQGKLVGKINWRIQEPDGEFLTKSTVQQFVQVKPGVLENHDNEYLHYQDDWFILDYDSMDDPEKGWVLVYYRGRNDAWAGYGGGTLYTRAKTIPPQILDRVKAACDKIQIPYDKFWKATDNSCNASPDPLKARASFAKKLLEQGELSAEEQLTYLARSAQSEIDKDERWAFESAIRIEKMTEKFVVAEADQLLKVEKAAERELVKDEQALEQVIKKLFSPLARLIPGS
jgi:violaxanthin de-epoxidase